MHYVSEVGLICNSKQIWFSAVWKIKKMRSEHVWNFECKGGKTILKTSRQNNVRESENSDMFFFQFLFMFAEMSFPRHKCMQKMILLSRFFQWTSSHCCMRLWMQRGVCTAIESKIYFENLQRYLCVWQTYMDATYVQADMELILKWQKIFCTICCCCFCFL